MENQPTLRETKKHGAAWFPFNIYPCAIPQDFTQVALHWQDSMELVFVKKGRGIVQAGLTSYTAAAGDIYVFAPGVLHALRQLDNERMEYENIIFDLELLGGQRRRGGGKIPAAPAKRPPGPAHAFNAR